LLNVFSFNFLTSTKKMVGQKQYIEIVNNFYVHFMYDVQENIIKIINNFINKLLE